MNVLEVLIVIILVLWLLGGFVVPVPLEAVRLLLVVVLILVVVRILQRSGSL